MGSICNQTTVVSTILEEGGETEQQQFFIIEMSAADQKFRQELDQLIQQEEGRKQLKIDFKEFLGNKTLWKHKDREEYYLGDWSEKTRKGRGVAYCTGEYLYYGDIDRVPSGKGMLKLYKQNIVINGDMKEGHPQGNCFIRDLNGIYTFEGIIKSDKLPHSGHFEVTNALTPEKSYSIHLDDYPEKKAKIIFKDGCEYEGDISFDTLLPQGEGEERYANKAVYTGGWENGKYHGKGKFTWPDGSSYEGDYVNGVKQGNGTYTYTSGKVYEGEWANGKQEGRGILRSADGNTLKKGKWANGSYIGEVEEDLEL